MKLTTYAQSLHDLNIIVANGLDEVILGHQDFSRLGKFSDEGYFKLYTRARELNLKVIFEWDILMTQDLFEESIQKISHFIGYFDSLRLQDPGAFEWALGHTSCPLHLIVENGNHNLLALKGWCEYAQGRLERLVLSMELSRDKIEEYCRELAVPCELLGVGPILLFYTPRYLLRPLKGETHPLNQEIFALGESEESPHKGFPIIENKHGTFMFHIKDFCLLEYAQDLRKNHLAYFRVDLRRKDFVLLSPIKDLVDNFQEEAFLNFKSIYGQDIMRGFYHVNKTDVLFPKLKNSRLQQREGNFVGEVLEAEKSSHLVILVRHPKGLTKSDELKVIHPEGKEFHIKLFSLKNISLEEVEIIKPNEIAIIQYVGGVWVKSQVFFT